MQALFLLIHQTQNIKMNTNEDILEEYINIATIIYIVNIKRKLVLCTSKEYFSKFSTISGIWGTV